MAALNTNTHIESRRKIASYESEMIARSREQLNASLALLQSISAGGMRDPARQRSEVMDDFERLLGRAVFHLWPNLSRDTQEQVFEAASSDPDIRRRLAMLLHDQHPRTAFAPRPAR